jgi:hypothetical protein
VNIEIHDTKDAPANCAAMAPRADLNLQGERLEIGPPHQRVKRKTQGVGLDAGELSDAHADFHQTHAWPPGRLRSGGFQNRVGNAQFVH